MADLINRTIVRYLGKTLNGVPLPRGAMSYLGGGLKKVADRENGFLTETPTRSAAFGGGV